MGVGAEPLIAHTCANPRRARSEIVCGVSVEDLCEHRDQPFEVGFGSRSVACAVQFGQVGLLPVESGAAFGEEEVEELAGGAAIALTEGVGEVRVVVQVCDRTCEICLGNSPELPKPVNLRGDMSPSAG